MNIGTPTIVQTRDGFAVVGTSGQPIRVVRIEQTEGGWEITGPEHVRMVPAVYLTRKSACQAAETFGFRHIIDSIGRVQPLSRNVTAARSAPAFRPLFGVRDSFTTHAPPGLTPASGAPR